jgi:hypothetical protein
VPRVSAPVDPEALIEEARRRARRRRLAIGAALLLALGAALGVFFAFGGGGTPTSRGADAQPPSRGVSPAVEITGTARVPLGETVLFAARAGTLFEVVLPPNAGGPVTLARIAPRGRVASRPARIERAVFLTDLTTGPDGLYAGTAVIKRFANVPDELVRIDPRTLTVRARASFPTRVAAVEHGARMWASLGDGRIVRLDPRTLAIRASRRVLPSTPVDRQSLSVSKPAFGLGSLWVLVGDRTRLELVRMDPSTLEVRSRTVIPTRGDLSQALYSVVANDNHVYLVGSAVVPVDADGKLAGRPVLVPDLATAAVHGSGLVGLTGGRPAVVLLAPTGRIRVRKRVLDAGAQLVVSGRDAWFLGNAGRGNGIVHVRLRTG